MNVHESIFNLYADLSLAKEPAGPRRAVQVTCTSTERVADCATAAKGGGGMAFPGGPTETPRSKISPFTMS